MTPSILPKLWQNGNKVKVFEWPSQNLDLNPIGNVWAELKKHVRARRPTNLTQRNKNCNKSLATIIVTFHILKIKW